jgi:tRNA(Ile)-lysidine synthase
MWCSTGFLLTPLILPCEAGRVSLASGHVRLPKPDEPVTVRFKAGGMLHIVGRNGGRKLKKIWQECNVPPWRAIPRRCCFTVKR